MAKVFISGLITYEVSVAIERFPVLYYPIGYPFFGINSSVSGVGFNIACAFSMLGDEIELYSIIGNDSLADLVMAECHLQGISTTMIRKELDATSQTVVLVDGDGRRQIHLDLKNIQEQQIERPDMSVLRGVDLLVACNINFSRPLLSGAKEIGIKIATDVHAIRTINDPYNLEFMRSADILFLSDEKIEGNIRDFVIQIKQSFNNEIIVVGRGQEGALMYYDNVFYETPAIAPREVINTTGAGDALFSAFIHSYIKDNNPIEALKKAVLFAGYKIGENGGAKGFLRERELEEMFGGNKNARTGRNKKH